MVTPKFKNYLVISGVSPPNPILFITKSIILHYEINKIQFSKPT